MYPARLRLSDQAPHAGNNAAHISLLNLANGKFKKVECVALTTLIEQLVGMLLSLLVNEMEPLQSYTVLQSEGALKISSPNLSRRIKQGSKKGSDSMERLRPSTVSNSSAQIRCNESNSKDHELRAQRQLPLSIHFFLLGDNLLLH